MIIILLLLLLFSICFLGAIILEIIQVLISKEETEATIVDINVRISGTVCYSRPNSTETEYHPVFEYYVDGKRYTKESFSGSSENHFEIGEKIKVKYPKNRPEDAFLARDTKRKTIGGLVIILAYIIYVAVWMIKLK